MVKVRVYTTAYCPFCDAAKRLLKQRNIDFEEIDVSEGSARAELKDRTGWRTVPQVFLDEELIGGYQELAAIDANGELVRRLKA